MASSSENEKQRLLVLGAGLDQCFMLKCARNLGVETLAVDSNPRAPGFSISDSFAIVSNRDTQGILDYLKDSGEKIHGVSTMGSDIPQVVSAVAHQLGLPAIPIAAAEIAVDKFRMKECFSRAGILVPDYVLVDTVSALLPRLEQWRRVVVKPLSQAGSKGVSLITCAEEAAPAFEQAREYADDGWVLAERYLPGDQISSESLIVDGVVHTPGLADRNYDELERFLPQIMENGGWVPSRYASYAGEIDRVIGDCARALGIDNGVIKGDLVRTEDGRFAVIEVAARLSGGDFCESLVPLGTGVNYVNEVIRQALGQPVDLAALEPTHSDCVANRYFFPSPGRLVRVEGLDEIKAKPWIRKLEVWYQPGDIVARIAGHGQRGGVFIVQGGDRDELARYIEEVYETIEFEIA